MMVSPEGLEKLTKALKLGYKSTLQADWMLKHIAEAIRISRGEDESVKEQCAKDADAVVETILRNI